LSFPAKGGESSVFILFFASWMPPAYYLPGQAYQVRHDEALDLDQPDLEALVL
jgi:hypothetical protein